MILPEYSYQTARVDELDSSLFGLDGESPDEEMEADARALRAKYDSRVEVICKVKTDAKERKK